MDLDQYSAEVEPVARIAERIGVTPGFMSQCKNGLRPWPPVTCVRIEQATAGKVTRRDLRPDDWHLIWPELVQKDAA